MEEGLSSTLAIAEEVHKPKLCLAHAVKHLGDAVFHFGAAFQSLKISLIDRLIQKKTKRNNNKKKERMNDTKSRPKHIIFLSSKNSRPTPIRSPKKKKSQIGMAGYPSDLANQGEAGQFDVLQRHKAVSQRFRKSFTSCEPTYYISILAHNSDQRHIYSSHISLTKQSHQKRGSHPQFHILITWDRTIHINSHRQF